MLDPAIGEQNDSGGRHYCHHVGSGLLAAALSGGVPFIRDFCPRDATYSGMPAYERRLPHWLEMKSNEQRLAISEPAGGCEFHGSGSFGRRAFLDAIVCMMTSHVRLVTPQVTARQWLTVGFTGHAANRLLGPQRRVLAGRELDYLAPDGNGSIGFGITAGLAGTPEGARRRPEGRRVGGRACAILRTIRKAD